VVDRTYAQFCALAKALDVAGERRSLLAVRELLAGPKRYTDLLAG
jgi:DNA-binding HxlR family transcriptional regulator